MQITCTHCGYNKEIDPAKLPAKITKVKCPKCKEIFPLSLSEPKTKAPTKTVPKAKVVAPIAPTPVPPAVPAPEPTVTAPSPAPQMVATNADIDALPKAGFWMRVVATLIDGFIVIVMQFVLGLLLGWAGIIASGGGIEAGLSTGIIVQIFGFCISFVYYVLFTGSVGQTPGKMALRIKVVNRDGSQLSYGRAAFREIPAKFISGIIFCIGYLMVAFDDQKQGLHDRMANTYVIKL